MSVIAPARLATLVGSFDRNPAYAGLAAALRALIADGRIPGGMQLPSERALTGALGVSRTTVTRAYALLVDSEYAVARRGAGTFTRLPGGLRAPDRALTPAVADGAIDLNCAAAPAPPGVLAAYAAAIEDLPRQLAGHGYYPAGLPELQQAIAEQYDAQGVPTDPGQILVVPGALAGAALVCLALTGRGDRVLVESPTYPNAVHALRAHGARLVPSVMDPWEPDLAGALALVRHAAPRLAYLVPDFHNPTGHLMSAGDRERYAAGLAQVGATPLIDESHRLLRLDGDPLPPPFATFSPGAITVGSVSKTIWGGLRIGWIRAPRHLVGDLLEARLSVDLGCPVVEQLVAAQLLREPALGSVIAEQHGRLRAQRDALAGALARRLPEWRFRMPAGGMCLWCELPPDAPAATAIAAAAERLGLVAAPGPVFAVAGGLDRFIRLPYAQPPEELTRAVDVLVEAVAIAGTGPGPRPGRVLVA